MRLITTFRFSINGSSARKLICIPERERDRRWITPPQPGRSAPVGEGSEHKDKWLHARKESTIMGGFMHRENL